VKELKPDVVRMRPDFPGFVPATPARSARQVQRNIAIKGVNAVQLAWWFQHLADKNGAYWKALSPANESIGWVVSLDEAANHIGTLWESSQIVPGGLFPDNRLHTQVQSWTGTPEAGQGDQASLPLSARSCHSLPTIELLTPPP